MVFKKPHIFQETFTETREVVDPAGTTFSCLYSLAYDPDRKVKISNLKQLDNSKLGSTQQQKIG